MYLHQNMESKGSSNNRYDVTLTDKTWESWYAQTKSNCMRYPDVTAMIQHNVEPSWTPRPYSSPMLDMDGSHLRGIWTKLRYTHPSTVVV